jgi:hypothetical protein
MATYTIPDSEPRYSLPVPAWEVKERGCFTTLPVRRNKAYVDSDEVGLHVKKEWARLISDGTSDYCHGPINHVSGSWVYMVLPEGKPRMLRLVTWFTMFFTLLDGELPRTGRHMHLSYF